MPRRTDSRSWVNHAATELFRQRGYYATTVSDVVRQSGAPRGSTYLHFPGGKQELAREAIARARDEIGRWSARPPTMGTPVTDTAAGE
jgi:TetR/AcrR family transcriptional regulator, lmrAB and yxaGH operons repressor